MKIAIPVNDKSTHTKIASTFGRAQYFLIYETEQKESSFIDNSAVASQGGAGIKAAQVIADSGAQILITPQCGENAAKVIEKAGVRMYKSQEGLALDNINAYIEGKLSVLEDIHSGYHNHGGK